MNGPPIGQNLRTSHVSPLGSPLESIPPAERNPSPRGRLGVLLPAMAMIATHWGDHPQVIQAGHDALEACGENPDLDFDDPTIS